MMAKKRVSKTKMAKEVGWEKSRVKKVDPLVAQSIANKKRRALEEAAKLNTARALQNSAAMGEVLGEGETVSGYVRVDVPGLAPGPGEPLFLDEENRKYWNSEKDVKRVDVMDAPAVLGLDQALAGGYETGIQVTWREPKTGQEWLDGLAGRDRLQDEASAKMQAEYRPDGYGGVEKAPEESKGPLLPPMSREMRDLLGLAPKPTAEPEKKSGVAGEAVPDWAREAQERPTPVNPDPLRDIKVAFTNYNLADIPNFWDKLKQQIKRRFYERVEEFVERDRRKVVVVRMAQHSMNPMDMGEFKRQMSATGRTVVFLEYKQTVVAPPVIEELR